MVKVTALALDLGYADQAHFIRDFRKLVGRLPAGYARSIWSAAVSAAGPAASSPRVLRESGAAGTPPGQPAGRRRSDGDIHG